MNRVIKFSLSNPERTTDTCPTCGMTEAQEKSINLHCGVFDCPGGVHHAHDPDELAQRIAEKQAAPWSHETHWVACEDPWHHDETEHTLPACWEICDRCKGEGRHTNPSIDGNGITEDEWNGPDWDDESREMYLSGGYDVTCEAGCSGGRVLVPDEEACRHEPLKTLLERYEAQQDARARSEAEDRAIRRYEMMGGCG